MILIILYPIATAPNITDAKLDEWHCQWLVDTDEISIEVTISSRLHCYLIGICHTHGEYIQITVPFVNLQHMCNCILYGIVEILYVARYRMVMTTHTDGIVSHYALYCSYGMFLFRASWYSAGNVQMDSFLRKYIKDSYIAISQKTFSLSRHFA